MADLRPPDVIAGLVARAKIVAPVGTIVTDEFPLNGAHAGQRLVTVEATGTDVDPRFTGQFDVLLNVWAPTRKESFTLAQDIIASYKTRGGFRLDVNGVVVRATCTLRPAREPSGETAETFVRHIARLDMFVRNTSTS